MSPERISQGLLLDEVDLPPEQLAEFIPHIEKIPETPHGLRLEGNQNIDVALGREVLAQNRAEQSELRHLPFPAELHEPVLRDIDAMEIHSCLYSTHLDTIRQYRTRRLPEGNGGWSPGDTMKAPVKAGGESWMREAYKKPVANHLDPESCAGAGAGWAKR